ncbi:DUF4291 family protein [Aliikangiella coralliicola]|uniref:DUF4291 family protein n=1 Tax=Aliikangiella coralliicola TaxID=2592383 RepID=UPI001AEF4459|nr:DUF4291 family protein [Aliikangiella coralliicola]
MDIPVRQVRAVYNDKTIRVYQAYNDAIANTALEHGTFLSPPFKMERMTWIKPSFLWMMQKVVRHSTYSQYLTSLKVLR